MGLFVEALLHFMSSSSGLKMTVSQYYSCLQRDFLKAQSQLPPALGGDYPSNRRGFYQEVSPEPYEVLPDPLFCE